MICHIYPQIAVTGKAPINKTDTVMAKQTAGQDNTYSLRPNYQGVHPKAQTLYTSYRYVQRCKCQWVCPFHAD